MRSTLLFVALTLAGASAIAAEKPKQDENATCLECHGSTDSGAPVVDPPAFAKSVHSGLTCVTCHDQVTDYPHPESMPRPDCASCHSDQAEAYARSIHGTAGAMGNKDVARCASCHGSPHQIVPVKDPASPVYPLNLPRTCGTCHGDAQLAARNKIPIPNAYQLYMDSIHGRAVTKSGLLVAANCSDCHGSHDIRPPQDATSTINRGRIPATCGRCHAGVLSEYEGSIHGRLHASGNLKAAVCVDCHTAHEIRRVDTEIARLDIVRECGTCHKESLRTYEDTFHGQVTSLGFTRTARCSDCHGSHGILPKADPRSRVNTANLVQTCGSCHSDANAKFVKYDPHADPHDRRRSPAYYYAARFMDLLLIGTFSFFGLHTALWAGRAATARKRGQPPPEPETLEEPGNTKVDPS